MKVAKRSKPLPLPSQRLSVDEAVSKFKKAVKGRGSEPFEPWNLWQHETHASHVYTFLTCQEQFRLQYQEGWQKPQTSEALEFGNAFHYCLEQAYRGKKAPSPEAVKRWVKEFEKQYKEDKKFGISEQDLEKLLGWTEVLLPFYFQQWAGDFKQKWVATELEWSAPYKYKDGRAAMMAGTIDGLYQLKAADWASDTKTRSTISLDDEVSTMPLNFQFNLYMWYLWQRKRVLPGGFVQNLVRRPGQTFLKSESLQQHLARVKEDVAKRPEWYFVRLDYAITWTEFKQWMDNQLDPIMWQLRLYQDGLKGADKWLPCWPNLPRFANPAGLKVGMRKVDMFAAITVGDFSGLRQGPWHGMKVANHAGSH